MNSTSIFSIYDFKELLDGIEREIQDSTVVLPVPEKKHLIQSTSSEQQPVAQSVQKAETVEQATRIPQAMPAQPTLVQNSVAQQPVVAPVQKLAPTTGFAIPGQKTEPVQAANNVPTESGTVSDEKEMSFVYLMRNYTKENAAIYKAQQDAKKAAKATAGPEKKDKKDKKEKKGKEATTSPMNTAFAIPGQPTAPAQPLKPNPVIVPQPASAPVVQPATYSAPQPSPYEAPTLQPIPVAPASQPTPMAQPVGMPANFGETTVLSSAGIGETTILGASPVMQEIKPYLVRSKNNEKIILDKPVFRIGKERSYVDYFIGDNSAISRSHANIVSRDGEYFVVDTNSTNHTYVNGGMLQSNVETKISHGTKIRLANEDFEFKLY